MSRPTFFSSLVVLFVFTFFSARAAGPEKSKMENNIEHLNWNGIDVVYIEDNRFPTFDLILYFADGALNDGPGESGLTSHSFSLLDSGTDKLSQKEILEQIEFLGVNLRSDVTHEYSTLSVSGLTKDLKTSMTQICSLMRSATYPEEVVKKELELERLSLANIIASPKALAERAFREVSLSKTPYAYPVEGKLADFKSYTASSLREKMNHFLDRVKKRLYITGPKSVLGLKDILAKDCQFKGEASDFVRSLPAPKLRVNKTEFVFVPVPDANQVQVRIGRFINSNETSERNLDALATEFLGGGFTSRLMKEVRVKRGLSYSIGSFVASQKQYGRAGISTFTKNATVGKLLEVIDQTIQTIEKEGISDAELLQTVEGMVGSYPFKFESNPAFLGQLLLLDHTERPYSDLFNFNESIKRYDGRSVARRIAEVFKLQSQTIFVVGDQSIEKDLRKLSKKYGKLKVLDYKKFL